MNKLVGNRIKMQRKEKKMTQEVLSEVTHIPKTTISAYENGKVDIKGSVLVELSKHLGTTPNYFLGVDQESPIDTEIRNLLGKIENSEVKKILLIQIRALITYL